MNARSFGCCLLLLVATGCGGSGEATLHGQLSAGAGQNFSPHDGEQIMMVFYAVGDDDKPDVMKSYPAMVEPDGKYRMVASGGKLPAGRYRVAVEALPMVPPGGSGKKITDRLMGRYNRGNSTLDVTIKSGDNDIPIDLGPAAK
jgi:hypothetical protein